MAQPTTRRDHPALPWWNWGVPEMGRAAVWRIATPKLQAFHATQWAQLSAAEAGQLRGLLTKALWGNTSDAG